MELVEGPGGSARQGPGPRDLLHPARRGRGMGIVYDGKLKVGKVHAVLDLSGEKGEARLAYHLSNSTNKEISVSEKRNRVKFGRQELKL